MSRVDQLVEQLRDAQGTIAQLTTERDALLAQLKGVGHVPYLERMAELATARNKAIAELAQLQAIARAIVRQFEHIKNYQYEQLVEGQTLETASENWETMEWPSIDFQPLIDALAGGPAPQEQKP